MTSTADFKCPCGGAVTMTIIDHEGATYHEIHSHAECQKCDNRTTLLCSPYIPRGDSAKAMLLAAVKARLQERIDRNYYADQERKRAVAEELAKSKEGRAAGCAKSMTTQDILEAIECCMSASCEFCPLSGEAGCSYKLLENCAKEIRRLDESCKFLLHELPWVATSTPTQPSTPKTRADILAAAEKCVCADREQQYGSPEDSFGRIAEQQYGSPEDSFGRIAELWSAYMGSTFTPLDVAMLMALLKIARIKTGIGTADSFVDLAGYAACGGEIAGGAQK